MGRIDEFSSNCTCIKHGVHNIVITCEGKVLKNITICTSSSKTISYCLC